MNITKFIVDGIRLFLEIKTITSKYVERFGRMRVFSVSIIIIHYILKGDQTFISEQSKAKQLNKAIAGQ